jgi:hypothetical protein
VNTPTHIVRVAAFSALLLAFYSGASSSAAAFEQPPGPQVWVQPAPQVPPVAIIEGRSQVDLGNPVTLDATKSTADAFVWVLDHDIDFVEFDGGKKAYFITSTPGRYTFTLVAISAPLKSGGSAQVAKTSFTVAYGTPGPTPPGPGPGPNPPTPDPGKYGLAAFVAQAAATVQSATRRQTAATVANNFDGVASSIAAGAITDPAEIIKQTYNLNAAPLSDPAWKPWSAAVRQKLNSISDAGQLTSATDYATAWREIAAGLRLVTRR